MIKEERGMSLIELLISISILGVILIAFSSLYLMGIKIYEKEARSSNLQAENRTILDRIIKDAKGAIGVQESVDAYTSDTTSTLILKVPSIDDDKKFISQVSGGFVFDYFVYKKTGTTLTRLIIPDPLSSRAGDLVKTISTNVSTFNIIYYPDIPDAMNLNITLNMEDDFRKEVISVNSTADVKFRNK